ncbi:MAG TPA: hypothetical protein VGS57_15880 [Thermoanaerobaculia bacterium]|nr:hypothetical protein [Thermoanaerobaculia bacterium]
MRLWRAVARTPVRADAPRSLPAPPAAPTPAFRSWALADLLRRREADRRWRVLDLGSANHNNMTFFVGRGASYVVEALYSTTAPCRTGGRFDTACMRALPDLLRFPAEMRFDAVLAWDLLDYLGAAGLAVLGERLAPHCHGRTLLHAMVAREGKLPAQPARWEIVDEHTIRQWPYGGPLLDAVRLTDASLQRALGSFRVDRSYLLQNGLQEFLLEPGAPSLPPTVAGPVRRRLPMGRS